MWIKPLARSKKCLKLWMFEVKMNMIYVDLWLNFSWNWSTNSVVIIWFLVFMPKNDDWKLDCLILWHCKCETLLLCEKLVKFFKKYSMHSKSPDFSTGFEEGHTSPQMINRILDGWVRTHQSLSMAWKHLKCIYFYLKQFPRTKANN